MRLEDIQLAIRPRSLLECLDIAFLFCGQHWVGLLLASAVGVVPLMIFNEWLLWRSPLDFYIAYLILAMEVPWATAFLTLYLGQVTFSKRFSLKRAARDFLRSLDRLIVYQVLIRGICLLMVVLAPVPFFGMYFINEIILLEQTPLTHTWGRRTAMNSRTLAKIVSLRLMEMVALVLGTLIVGAMLRTISELWEDRFQFHPDVVFTNLFETDWQTRIAFWVMIIFLTVFRFVSYLDCRIRREGWDVELKLRAHSTRYHQREAAL